MLKDSWFDCEYVETFDNDLETAYENFLFNGDDLEIDYENFLFSNCDLEIEYENFLFSNEDHDLISPLDNFSLNENLKFDKNYEMVVDNSKFCWGDTFA